MQVCRRPTHRPSRWLSGWLIASVLFMQIATAAYACPKAAAALAEPAAETAMPGCEAHRSAGLDMEQPQLCQAHCQLGSQAAQAPAALDVPGAAALAAVLDWRTVALLPRQPARLAPGLAPGDSPPGSPPLYLRLLVLRN